jgi:hypothetical protein
VLACFARSETGSKGGGGRVRLSNVDTWELAGILELVGMPFRIDDRRGWGGIRKLVDDMDGPAFLERDLVGLGVDGYR